MLKKLIILLIIATPLHLCAQEGDIEAILQSIATNNLELKALMSQNQSILLDMKQENTPTGPVVEYSPFYTKGYHGMASSELVVTQEFDFPTQYADRNKQRHLSQDALQHEYEALRSNILLEARLLCLDIIMQNQIVEMQEERNQQNANMVNLLQKRLEAGDANILEVNKAKLEEIQTLQELAEVKGERTILQQQLQLLNGGKAIELKQNNFPGFPEPSKQTYPRLSPEQQAAQAELIAREHEESISKRGWLPALNVGYRRNTDGKTQLNGFLVGATFPLYGQGTRNKAARERKVTAQLKLEEVRQADQISQEARYEELCKLHEVLDHSDTDLLHETLTLLEKALIAGQITALQYYAERENIYEKLLAHIQLHCKYAKSYTQVYLRW